MLNIEFGVTVLRIFFGLLFAGHGAQKLFGWFGGGGLNGTHKMVTNLGMQPVKFWALVAGASEFFGGLGLSLGLLTPIAGAVIIGVMLMAIIKVHWKNGFWNSNRGFEFPLLNLLLAAFVGLYGPGLFSLDQALRLSFPMPWTFLAALILVIIGLLGGLLSGHIFKQQGTHDTGPGRGQTA
jgi:putative oxidoreductase